MSNPGSADRSQLAETLARIDAALWAGVLLGEDLPSIATDLLVAGAELASLTALAGLDPASRTSRDARDLFEEALTRAGAERLSTVARVDAAAQLLAVAYRRGSMTQRDLLQKVAHLWMLADYPAEPRDVAGLYALKDELTGGWGRSHEEIGAEIDALTARIARGAPQLPEAMVTRASRPWS